MSRSHGTNTLAGSKVRRAVVETLENRQLFAITPFLTQTGLISLSLDAAGSNDVTNGATIQVQKPAGATVRSAYLFAATIQNSPVTIAAGDITLDGKPVSFPISTTSAINSKNYRGDVTSLVKSKIDSAPAGLVNFNVKETKNTTAIDGEILAVIFNDPTQTKENTIVLLFGAQATTGDTFNIGLANPFDPAVNKNFDMSLGISYGASRQTNIQYSTIDVDGKRLTSSAGAEDDGLLADGALITVGGIGDTNSNPANPNAIPTTTSSPRDDDELYNLTPFVAKGKTSIAVATRNPSNDDNIFFAAFSLQNATAVVGEGIVLAPSTQTKPAGQNASLTATVQDINGKPVANRAVTFTVTSGPNNGKTQTVNTNSLGKAVFTYTGPNAGTDTVTASFKDSTNTTKTSNNATVIFTAPEVAVLGNNVSINDNDTTPSTTDGTDFGSVVKGAASPTKVFTVKNTGTAPLTTSGLVVPSGFSIVEGLSSTIAAGASDTITIKLNTATAGTFQGNLSFANNDGNENPYNFTIKGVVIAPTGSFSGALFHDFNGDGIKDAGESILSGWTVFLDKDKDGVLDAGEVSKVTDANGAYSFTGVTNGAYRVAEVLKSGWVSTRAFVDVTVAGNSSTGKNLGAARPVTISGNVFKDTNADGFRDTNETALSGWKLFIDADNDGILDSGEKSVVTDASGNFSFTGLKPGTFSLRLIVSTGFVATSPTQANIALRSGSTSSGNAFGAK